MRRILHIIDSLGHSGIANQMLLLARGLASHGFEVHVAVLNASSTFDRSTCGRDFPIINVGRRWSIDPLADLRLARHITKLQPEIVHTWNTIPGMFGPLAASFTHQMGDWGRTSGKPLVHPLFRGRILYRPFATGMGRILGTAFFTHQTSYYPQCLSL